MPKPAGSHRAVPGGRRHRARGPTQRKAARALGRHRRGRRGAPAGRDEGGAVSLRVERDEGGAVSLRVERDEGGAVSLRVGRRGRRGASAGRDERGGAVSLWVLLMVPVSAFAAVVAMAGPQRLAAESSMQEAADDLAMFAVAWRDGHGMHKGELPAFFPECRRSDDQQIALDGFDDQIHDPALVLADEDQEQARVAALRDQKDDLREQVVRWEDACKGLRDAMIRDLGYLGVDMGSLRGFYSDSLTMSDNVDLEPPPLPCRTSKRVVVNDAVHVALAADWQDAGWAAAQVWPEGMRMGAESMGRLSRADSVTSVERCEQRPEVLERLARSVDRTALSG